MPKNATIPRETVTTWQRNNFWRKSHNAGTRSSDITETRNDCNTISPLRASLLPSRPVCNISAIDLVPPPYQTQFNLGPTARFPEPIPKFGFIMLLKSIYYKFKALLPFLRDRFTAPIHPSHIANEKCKAHSTLFCGCVPGRTLRAHPGRAQSHRQSRNFGRPEPQIESQSVGLTIVGCEIEADSLRFIKEFMRAESQRKIFVFNLTETLMVLKVSVYKKVSQLQYIVLYSPHQEPVLHVRVTTIWARGVVVERARAVSGGGTCILTERIIFQAERGNHWQCAVRGEGRRLPGAGLNQ
ncbi:hypothetical protein C8F04DRAFT_1195785 [Mycena alexandri]|uniref:Uncharacterized protein n=1 Tax=Mycena alexandri TaxID=1745969 RepID=A0AAD6S600_9AGAR|nr:hypothetical protein C8F04DRAFT_1195785 [Mycena alexandri]